METNFNFNSAVCTSREQSKKLLSLGLKKETADMYITNMSRKGLNYTDDWQIGSISYCDVMSFWDSKGLQLEKTAWSIIPAWSLGRLIEMIKKSDYLHYDDMGCIKLYLEQDDFDRVIAIISIMVKEGYFNKEYLV